MDYIFEGLYTLVILSYFIGYKNACNFILQALIPVNNIIEQIMNTSILSIMFGSIITYLIVRLVLTAMSAPRGKHGHIIGKILYATIGCFIGKILDNVAKVIF